MNKYQQLLEQELKDLYSAENQLMEALPTMAQAAAHPHLKQTFRNYLRETQTQLERLEQVADMMGISLHSHEKCQEIKTIIEKGSRIINGNADPEVKDAGIIGIAQKAGQYKILGYGVVSYFAKTLGEKQAAGLLGETLYEKKMTNETLKNIAAGKLNKLAVN